MTLGGWLTLILSVGSVCLLFAWCVYRVLTDPAPVEHLHGVDDIDTPDANESLDGSQPSDSTSTSR